MNSSFEVEVGKSTPTKTRAIKSGRISATKNEIGGYEINPSELFRVFPPVTGEKGDVKGRLLGVESWSRFEGFPVPNFLPPLFGVSQQITSTTPFPFDLRSWWATEALTLSPGPG